MTAPVEVLFYGRPDCHLCEEVREEIDRLTEQHGWNLNLREVDIESDDELFKRYLERIPVVAVDGEELFEFFVDEGVLERRVRGTVS